MLELREEKLRNNFVLEDGEEKCVDEDGMERALAEELFGGEEETEE